MAALGKTVAALRALADANDKMKTEKIVKAEGLQAEAKGHGELVDKARAIAAGVDAAIGSTNPEPVETPAPAVEAPAA